jgi:endonuclease YncB( thermonuclease family)
MSRSRSKIGCLPVIIILMVAGYMRGSKNGPAARPLAPEQHQVAQAEAPAAAPSLKQEAPPEKTSRPVAVQEPVHHEAHRRSDHAQLHLRVVGVHDGDTVTGLDESKTQYKIRLDAIDAPELGQPFGQASKKALSEKVFGKDVVVIPKTKDKYGRTVGHILIDGRDVNLLMLEEGMAWHYKHYDHNARLARAEEEAHEAKKGLWSDGDPVPPWEWRKEHQDRKEAVR